MCFSCGDNDVSDKSCSTQMSAHETKSVSISSSTWIGPKKYGLFGKYYVSILAAVEEKLFISRERLSDSCSSPKKSIENKVDKETWLRK